MKVEGRHAGSETKVSRYRFTSLEAVAPEPLISPTFPSSSRKEQVRVLSRVVISLLEPLRNCTETGLEVTRREQKVWSCFLRVVSYFCDIPEAK